MAVAFDNAITNQKVGTASNVISATMTPGALTNPCAIVAVYGFTTVARTVSTVKLDATTDFTFLGRVVRGTTDGWTAPDMEIWYLVGASITNASHTFDVTWSGNSFIQYIGAFTFSGVDQTTPVASFTSDIADTTSPVAISPSGGTANDLLFASFVNWNDPNQGAVDTGTTQRGTTQGETSQEGTRFLCGTAAGNASSIGFTWSASLPAQSTAGCVIKAVSGGGGATGWGRLLMGSRNRQVYQ